MAADLVERVARALADEDGDRQYDDPDDDIREEVRGYWQRLAEVAIRITLAAHVAGEGGK